jgi:hypothetical protein
MFIAARSWKEPKCPSTEECIKKMWYIYTMEYYSAINNEFMKFLGKWMYLEDMTLSEVTHTKEHTWYALTDKWIISPEARKTQDTILKTHETQGEGRPKSAYFGPS